MPKEVSRAKELARESVAHYWVTDGMTEEQLAEYAVNLALTEARNAQCQQCADGLEYQDELHYRTIKGRRRAVGRCGAIPTRSLMDAGRPA